MPTRMTKAPGNGRHQTSSFEGRATGDGHPATGTRPRSNIAEGAQERSDVPIKSWLGQVRAMVLRCGAYPLGAKRHTGMPSLLALSARLS